MNSTVSQLAHLTTSHPSPAESLNGGTIVSASGRSLSIHSHAWSSYSLSNTYTFNLFSKLSFLLTSGARVNIFVCFSQNLDFFNINEDEDAFCLRVNSNGYSSSLFFGDSNPNQKLRLIYYSLAMGKPTASSSVKSVADNPTSAVVDGNTETAFKSLREDYPYFDIYLQKTHLISHIIIHRGPECVDHALENFSLSVLDDTGRKKKFHNQYHSKKDITRLNIPITSGLIVRIQLQSERKTLCLGEVEIYESSPSAVKEIDIPIGKVLNGTKAVNYVTFVQESYSSSAEISDMKFTYGDLKGHY